MPAVITSPAHYCADTLRGTGVDHVSRFNAENFERSETASAADQIRCAGSLRCLVSPRNADRKEAGIMKASQRNVRG